VVKALCLGAKGVGLGRPMLYALTYGEEGVVHAIESESPILHSCFLIRLVNRLVSYETNGGESLNVVWRVLLRPQALN
jgi:hypothetical protein